MKRFVHIFVVWVICAPFLCAQVSDSTVLDSTVLDSTVVDSTVLDTAPKQSMLEAPVHYTANDSIVLYHDGVAELHGAATVKYTEMDLTAEYIRCKMDSNLVYATGKYDSLEGEWVGKPIFKDHSTEYNTDEITYNLSTKKGFIRGVVTEQGEGFVTASQTKKLEDDIMMMKGGHYTTCDQHDCPHFHLQLTKAKVKPNGYVVTGPAYMVLGGVPLPLAIPFGYFPFTSAYSSGLIMPNFGDDQTRGMYLDGLGYYFAFNDYFDTEITADLYTRGTWALRLNTKYLKRYKFNGHINMTYRVDVTGDKDMPDYMRAMNFNLQWTHTQDPKANPFCTFSASVNFSTSGYNRSNIQSYYNVAKNAENTKSSSISYTQRFPESAWSLGVNINLSQRTRDSTLAMTMPTLTANMARLYPFKRKKPIGKERWYEKIYLSYSGTFQNSITCKEDMLFKSSFSKDWSNGLKHSIPIGASFNVFKYLNVSPSISLTDRMYFRRVDESWNDQENRLQRDTSSGFYNVFDFSLGVSLSTKIYGFFIPLRHKRVDRFRNVITPTVSFNYHPDFGGRAWGYYGQYMKGDEVIKYSRYQGALYGNAPQGLSSSLNYSLAGQLEMKVLNRKDTTGKNPYKIVSIFDNWSISGGYNFAADSMNWSMINVNLRLKIPVVNYTLNLSSTFDPYMYTTTPTGSHVRCNEQYISHGKVPHWLGTSTSVSYTFSGEQFKKWFSGEGKKSSDSSDDEGSSDEDEEIDKPPVHTPGETDDAFVKTDIPWSLTVNYSIRYGQSGEWSDVKNNYLMELTHNLAFSGNLGLGAGWNISASTSFDFKVKRFATTTFTVSRNLHCWNMSASIVPFGTFASYNFHIGVNAGMLKDLKYDKTSASSSNVRVTWY